MVFYLAQILASIHIVSKRGIRWGSLMRSNKGLLLFYLFILASTVWSPYPFVSFKRWFKDLGGIFVTLVIMTEAHPLQAIGAVFARCAYVLFPLSVVCIKYFPDIGRSYSNSGVPMVTGVTQQKNSLGEIVLVFGLVIIYELVNVKRDSQFSHFKGRRFTALFTMTIGLWLLITSDSKTSLICLILGAGILTAHKLRLFNGHPRRFILCLVVGPCLIFSVDSTFQISDSLLNLVGRDPTLTERTEIWKTIRDNPVDPLIGSGYMMYWEMHKTIQIGDLDKDGLKSIHNGYLEMYLDGGTLGICVLVIMLVSIGVRVTRSFIDGDNYSRVAFAFFVVMLVYNVSESMYARRSPLWFAFVLFSLHVPKSLECVTQTTVQVNNCPVDVT
jgi:exopolysaccharide production protein ExoQ